MDDFKLIHGDCLRILAGGGRSKAEALTPW